MNDRVVYLMCGLPACGKSHKAKRLAGPTGVAPETNEYFYSQVGNDPQQYDYSEALRLVERGVRFVQLYSGSGSKWDAHKGIADEVGRGSRDGQGFDPK